MQQQEVAMLILQRGEDSSQRWPLDQELVNIGRGPNCEIVLSDRVVSREHAYILHQEGGYYLFDLESKNGTFVNGEAVEGSRALHDGDEIQIALRFRLTFVEAGATAPLTMDLITPVSESGLQLDDTRRTVEIQGQVLTPSLSVAQYRLLKTLVEAEGAVVSRDAVVGVVWPEDESTGVTEQAIDALVRRLRERLAELDSDHRYIITVRGHGFRFENHA